MEIKRVSLIGLGALGGMFGHHLARSVKKGDLRVIVDAGRRARYQEEGIYCNGAICDFELVTPDEEVPSADLILIGVKFHALSAAIESIRNHVGPHTLILSMLNGISSEQLLAEAFGAEKVIYCVAQGMDAMKEGNQIRYANMGVLCVGERNSATAGPSVQAVTDFFERHDFPYLLDNHMEHRLWGKFMLNVGVNQSVAVYETTYGGIQQEGIPRTTMIHAMREVVTVSEQEGVNLTEADVDYWLQVVGKLSPEGKPSLRQDLEAGRRSEVELFAGKVRELGQKHGIATPVNDQLYSRILAMEAGF